MSCGNQIVSALKTELSIGIIQIDQVHHQPQSHQSDITSASNASGWSGHIGSTTGYTPHQPL